MGRNNFKLAWSQLNFKIYDFDGNFKKIETIYKKYSDIADFVVFSEMSLSGYSPNDLIYEKSFLDLQSKYLERLRLMTKGHRAWMVIGCVQERLSDTDITLKNGLYVFGDNCIKGEYQKRLLPTYDIFDEKRYFSPGKGNLIIEKCGIKVGFLICEDMWHDRKENMGLNPVGETVKEGIDLLVGINASPSSIGKAKIRQEKMRNLCVNNRTPLLYVNQVGVNDEVVFDGGSFFYNKNGSIAFRAKTFKEGHGVVELLQDGQWGSDCGISEIDSDMDIYYKHACGGLRDFIKKQNLKSVVVGCSGGIDSALTIALAVDALGKDCVTAITMPSRFSSKSSVTDSSKLCNNLGIKLIKRSIDSEVNEAIKNFKLSFGESPNTLTIENIQARIRGRILMEYSNHFGNIVLATGNKSELSVGYATLYGDMNGGINLLGDIYKTDVYKLSYYINSIYSHNNKECIPKSILLKEPSAELSDNQRDSDTLPDYNTLDAILRDYIECGCLSDEQRKKDQIVLNVTNKDIIKRVIKMVCSSEFKRNQAPLIIRMRAKSFGIGRKIPIVYTINNNY